MTLRDDAMRKYPDFPWLAAGDCAGIEQFLRTRGWIEHHETIEACQPAGAGNMNLTLLIETRERRFILKQARPWVEKYPDIPAPWDRGVSEAGFYARIATIDAVSSRMPRMLAQDSESRVLVLEYLPGQGDFGDLYDPANGARLEDSDIETAANFLASLHSATRGSAEPGLANREMRALNHAHIFEIPFQSNTGVDLEALEPGLSHSAQRLRSDGQLGKNVRALADRYLADGPCLLHGDYFPGSWLRGAKGLFVIDPEFCFFGAAEIDLGCAIAHLAVSDSRADQANALLAHYESQLDSDEAAIDSPALGRFAAIEVIRRLIGVAQLPIPIAAMFAADDPRRHFRSNLLARAHETLLSGQWCLLFAQVTG